MWRPKNWAEMHIIYDECLHDWQHIADLKDRERVLVNAGADAMLKALREDKDNAVHFGKGKWTDDATFETDKPGTVVFIPDEIDEERKDGSG